ncbi:aldo/keto reductase [Paenibacillus rhizovicinus]|uniref:Aldo/keto reductase n=1 Tax=Paenibacillus rhizovicinus TaxID=2704463 RepID=A0A6C0NZS0_9BACL|nr:aldo/keto reductase [Paenibacillus rhizovicinus]QHW31718.1 aldo/keto reductase [Paenibacillus rhizovicinus]
MLQRKLGNTELSIPVIGQGTWKFGEDKQRERQEIDVLRYGIENGLTLIDTAEAYADGGSERVVGQAIQDVRDKVFLVTKVATENCSYEGVLQAAEGSLERLKTDRIDLYLQHWPSDKYAVSETMSAMAELVKRGMIKHVGVSNYSVPLMQEAQRCLGDVPLACNQVPYHLNDRLIENELIPYCRENGITVMGYSPFGYAPHVFGGKGFPEAGSQQREVLDAIGARYGKTAYQVALNWVLRQEGLVTIPKAASRPHMKDNIESVGWELGPDDLERIEAAFPIEQA